MITDQTGQVYWLNELTTDLITDLIGDQIGPFFSFSPGLIPSDTALPFKFQRIQFPLKLAYCLTINKSQGQEFETVGIYLPAPVFSHGQLYVAFSRAKRFSSVFVQINDSAHQCMDKKNQEARTVNVVHSFRTR